MKQITLTQKDIEKAKICNSENGMLIDELAYASGQWTSEELYSNNFEYEPHKPYNFDYEADLLKATKTAEQLYELAQLLEVSINANWSRLSREQGLQAGACMALNNAPSWNELLTAYTDKLEEDGVDGISEAYNKELQEEKDSYNDDQYREWLNGDHRNYAGVVYEIAKYFTDGRDGSYDEKKGEYTFTLSDYDIENAGDYGYSKNQLKAWLLDSIIGSGNDRARKDKAEREARKEERERLAEYKREQNNKVEEERKAKLLAMTL